MTIRHEILTITFNITDFSSIKSTLIYLEFNPGLKGSSCAHIISEEYSDIHLNSFVHTLTIRPTYD